MGFTGGIIGLPNVGKSTVFNALTAAGAEVANYPFCTIDPNVGIVHVPDERFEKIAEIIKPLKTTYTTMEFLDIAGLVKGASRGEGLGNQFLGNIRPVDALIHVVRCFEDKNVVYEGESIDPIRDVEIINTELLLSDIEIVSRRITKMSKLARTGDKQAREELEALKKIESGLNEGVPARRIEGNEHHLKELSLLTTKPVLYLVNVSEPGTDRSSEHAQSLMDLAGQENVPVVTICGKLEDELQELDEEEKQGFLREYGFERSGLEELIIKGYQLLELITFYTTVSEELRAWTVKKGTRAPAAAGKIHSDMEKGFIKAEVISYEDFITAGALHHAREEGHLALEGKEYEVKDGDIITFKFSV